MRKVVYICDWLPPDFGAVGQYSVFFSRQRAGGGQCVVLGGLSSTRGSVETEDFGRGSLCTIRLKVATYDRAKFFQRLIWTIATNLRLLWRLRRQIARCDEIVFTGSPPFLLHFLVPLNLFLRKKLTYRITDFHPECLMAQLGRTPWPLTVFYRLTITWRHKVHRFEALGEDQRRRLLDMGIPEYRIVIKRDPSPVHIGPKTKPAALPSALQGHKVLLYSGNFGVAHDHETFVEGYRLHHREGSATVRLWLNATGAKADLVENAIHLAGLPVVRSLPGPLEDLPGIMVSPAAHLITLSDPFVGYVLPSKVYACVESGRPVLFIGPAESDVHLLCERGLPQDAYWRIPVGDPTAVATALEAIGSQA